MADQTLQQAGAQALLNVPALLKRGIDPSKLKVVDSSDQKGKVGYHANAIAGFDKNDPNTLHVFDKERFLADPQPTIAHELTHHLLNAAGPGFMQTLQPIDPKNPYQYDQNTVGSLPLTKQSEEQIAQKIGDYQAAMTSKDPAYTPQVKMQLQQQIQPLYDQLAKVPSQPVMQTNQPGAADQINTNPNAPTVVFEAQQPTPPAPDGSQGSLGSFTDDDIVQPAFSDEDILTPSQTHQQENKQNLRSGLVGAAKGVGDALLSTSPLGTGISMIPAVQRTLAANGPQEVAGKIASAGTMAALTPAVAEEEASTQLGNVAQKLKQAYSDAHVTDAMHGDIHAALGRYAAKVGIDYDPQQPIRNAIPQIIDGVTQKAQALQDKVAHVFSGLVGDTGDVEQLGMEGDYNKLKQNVVAAQKKVDSTIGGGKLPAHEAAKAGLQQAQADMALANHMLDEQGLKGAREQADALFKQAEDLKKINKSLNKNTTGLKAEGVNTTPERVNGQKLTPELEQHYANGTLQNAFDEQTSHDLLNASAQGGRMQRSALRNKIVTGAAVPAALGAMGVGHHMVRGAAEAAIGAIP